MEIRKLRLQRIFLQGIRHLCASSQPDSSLSHTKIYVIIGAEEKQATPEEAFVFPAPISERMACGAGNKRVSADS